MGKSGDSGRQPQRRIDGAARAAFLAAVKRGLRFEEAAAEVGFSLPGFYGVRKRDPVFRLAWAAVHELAAARERLRAPPPMNLPVAANNRRRLQARQMRHVRFDDARRDAFLAHFAGTCDTRAAADAAGVDHSTVYKHRRRDPVFAAEWDRALDQGYARLEAEAVRQRLAAQDRMREEIVPTGEVAAEFERVMKLLVRWQRRDGRIGLRDESTGNRQGWTFERAIAALADKLKALDIPILELPPAIAARYDAAGGGSESRGERHEGEEDDSDGEEPGP